MQGAQLVSPNGNVAREWHLKVVVNFMHYFLLYCRLQKLDPRRTRTSGPYWRRLRPIQSFLPSRMLAALIEKNYKWYQQLFSVCMHHMAYLSLRD